MAWSFCPQGNAPWRSFTDIFAPFQSFGAEHGKPMIVRNGASTTTLPTRNMRPRGSTMRPRN